MNDEYAGRRDPSSGHSKDLLLGYIRSVKGLRDDRRGITEEIAEIKKAARKAGFDGTKIEEVVRWLEKVEKHGRDVMDEAEAIFDLYRTVADGNGKDFDEIMDDARDRALLKIFAPDDQLAVKPPTQKQQAASTALAYAEISRMNRGEG